MYTLTKKYIGVICGGLSLLSSLSVCAKGHDKKNQHRKDKNYSVVVSLHSGRSFVYSGNQSLASHKTQPGQLNTRSLFITKPFSKHIKLQGGIDFNTTATARAKNINVNKPYSFALPVTLQVYPLKQKSRVQPFFGAGFQYNLNVDAANISPFSSSELENPNSIIGSGTRFISIVFMQGITYEISTKIQISESVRFIPGTQKTIGVDIGVGYKLP